MNSEEQIKEALHTYIEQADAHMLAILQAVMEADQRAANDALEHAFQLAEDRKEQVNNNSMSISSWQEVKNRLNSRG